MNQYFAAFKVTRWQNAASILKEGHFFFETDDPRLIQDFLNHTHADELKRQASEELRVPQSELIITYQCVSRL